MCGRFCQTSGIFMCSRWLKICRKLVFGSASVPFAAFQFNIRGCQTSKRNQIILEIRIIILMLGFSPLFVKLGMHALGVRNCLLILVPEDLPETIFEIFRFRLQLQFVDLPPLQRCDVAMLRNTRARHRIPEHYHMQ